MNFLPSRSRPSGNGQAGPVRFPPKSSSKCTAQGWKRESSCNAVRNSRRRGRWWMGGGVLRSKTTASELTWCLWLSYQSHPLFLAYQLTQREQSVIVECDVLYSPSNVHRASTGWRRLIDALSCRSFSENKSKIPKALAETPWRPPKMRRSTISRLLIITGLFCKRAL